MSDMDKITTLRGLWAVTLKATVGSAVLKTSPKMLRTLRKRALQAFALGFLIYALMDPFSAGKTLGNVLVCGLLVSPLYVMYRIGRKRGARHTKKA